MQPTVNQQRVLAALRQASGPLGACAVLDRVRGTGFRAPAAFAIRDGCGRVDETAERTAIELHGKCSVFRHPAQAAGA